MKNRELPSSLEGITKSCYYYTLDPIPVSYTHLDVYKRQMLPTLPLNNIILLGATGRQNKMCIRDRLIIVLLLYLFLVPISILLRDLKIQI